jgi:TRAP transporter TAXI family solute receptor
MKRSKLVLFSSLLLALVMLITLMACAQSAPSSTPAPQTTSPQTVAPTTVASTSKPATSAPATTAAAVQLPKQTIIGTSGGTAVVAYTLMTAIAPIIEKSLGTTTRVSPYDVETDQMIALRDGANQLGFIHINSVRQSLEGTPPAFASETTGPMPIRLVWYVFASCFGYYVSGDSSIKTMADIKGKRVATCSNAPPVVTDTKALLAFAGLTEKDVTIVDFPTYADNTKSVIQGKADIAAMASVSSVAPEVESSPKGIRYIPMPASDKAGWERFHAVNPMAVPNVLNLGIKSAIGIEGYTQPYFVATSANMSDDVIYQYTKFFVDQYQNYKGSHDYLAFATLDAQRTWLNTCPFPVHPGTIKYLKEKGIWTAADDQWNQQALAKSQQFQDAWKPTVAQAKSQGIKIDINNKDWISLWSTQSAKIEGYKLR